MDIVSLDSKFEFDNFINTICLNLKGIQFHIGAYTIEGKSLDKWYWASSGKRIDYSNFGSSFRPTEPNFKNNDEWCLAAVTLENKCSFNDVPCTGYGEKFVCQKLAPQTAA
jgi:hypothetical protein